MSIRELQVSDMDKYTFRLSGDRLTENDTWEPFTATVTIDWERLAEFFCTGGRKKFGHSSINVDCRIYKPKEITLD